MGIAISLNMNSDFLKIVVVPYRLLSSYLRTVRLLIALLLGVNLCLTSTGYGDTSVPAVDSCPYFSNFWYFVDPDNDVMDYWWNVGSSTLTNGHIVYAYENGNGGTSTLECDPSNGTVVLWTITPSTGNTFSYVDATPTGQLGTFKLQSGVSAFATGGMVTINGLEYDTSGNFLAPCCLTDFSYETTYLWTFAFNNAVYTAQDVGLDYAGRIISHCNGGATVVSSFADIEQYPEQVEIGLSNGTVAKYVGGTGMSYSYRPSSTAPNQLTKINGYSLSTSGTTVSWPTPVISSFVWNGDLYTVDMVFWTDNGEGSNPRYLLNDGYHSSTALYPSGMTPYINDDYFAAVMNLDGSFGGVELTSNNNGTNLAGGPVNFIQSGVIGNSSFTFINNHPYFTTGNSVIPIPPVDTFTYGGNAYQYTSTNVGANNTFVTQYTAPGGATATMTWSQATNEMVSMQIKPTANGGTAKYVNGDAVGRPGAYVLSATSTLSNLLTQVNTNAFTPSGDAALPSGGFVNSNGVFDIQGDFMSLGRWSNDSTHVGFNLSYDDGTPVTTPASIEFTAGRTLTNWLWDAVTSDGTGVNLSMQLDQNSRLMLYPVVSTNVTSGPAVPPPAIILDTSATNPSDFTGVVRFEGPVRIAPQGDLSMGAFTQDAFPAQPTQ